VRSRSRHSPSRSSSASSKPKRRSRALHNKNGWLPQGLGLLGGGNLGGSFNLTNIFQMGLKPPTSNSNIYYFHHDSLLGEDEPILTSIFFKGFWNHQLDYDTLVFWFWRLVDFRFLDDHNSAPVAYAILTGISYPLLQNFRYQQNGVGGINFALCMALKTRLGYQNGPRIWDHVGFGGFRILSSWKGRWLDCNTLSFKGLVLFLPCRGISNVSWKRIKLYRLQKHVHPCVFIATAFMCL